MEDFANSAFTDGRSPTTFELQMLKDKVQRREIGMRLKQLRERSPFSQKVIAQEMGITTRHYQNWENPGTGDFESVERIAKLHWERWAKDDPQWDFVSAGWIWDGKDRREVPDVMGQMNGQSQLDRIEAALNRIEQTQAVFLSHVEAGAARQELPDDDERPARAAGQSAQTMGAKGRRGTTH